MKRFFCIFLCVFLLLTFALPAFAGNTIILMYEPWLFFYDLKDTEENYNIWLGMYSYGGTEELYPIHIDEDAYNAKLAASENSGNFQSGDSRVVESVPDKPSLSDGDSVSSDLHSESDSGHFQSSSFSSRSEPSFSQPSTMALTTVPTSGQSYILPEVVNIEYAPDAPAGSLLAVLYGLLGKPVVSYTYMVKTSRDSSYTGYLVQQLDYDANWVASLFLLIVVLFCIFKAGGALLCRA